MGGAKDQKYVEETVTQEKNDGSGFDNKSVENKESIGSYYNAELAGLPLTSREEINNVKLWDKTCQFVAIVREVKGALGTAPKRYLKGHLETEDDVIPFIAWNDDIMTFQEKLKLDMKIFMENVFIKPLDRQYDRSSTVGFQCTLVSGSSIEWICNAQQATEDIGKVYHQTTLENVCTHDGFVELMDVYIKSAPIMFHQDKLSSYKICSVTDGRLTFQVRFGCDKTAEVKRGDAVVVKGLLVERANPPYVLVKKDVDFVKKPDVSPLPVVQVIQASKAVKRKSDFNDGPPATKRKE